MSRSKQEISELLASRHIVRFFRSSQVDDLLNAINARNAGEQTRLISLLRRGDVTGAGKMIRGWLLSDAQIRAKNFIDDRLANDSLDITELDEVL